MTRGLRWALALSVAGLLACDLPAFDSDPEPLPPDAGEALCSPRCEGRTCGPDGCGGTCGPGCNGGSTCTEGVCIAPPVGCTGACACTSIPRSCTHNSGGIYGDGACAADGQCCQGTWFTTPGACGPCACSDSTGVLGCAAPFCAEAFAGRADPLSEELRATMTGKSWKVGCPVGLEDLRLLTMTHWGFDQKVHTGQLVVHAQLAQQALSIFKTLYELRFPIEKMKLVDDYEASDERSMADNNTSAFNCRSTTGGTSFSAHAYGKAVDINPVQNPYVLDGAPQPDAGFAYLDRSVARTGMILDQAAARDAFRALGWSWGGEWRNPRDYQHFQARLPQ